MRSGESAWPVRWLTLLALAGCQSANPQYEVDGAPVAVADGPAPRDQPGADRTNTLPGDGAASDVTVVDQAPVDQARDLPAADVVPAVVCNAPVAGRCSTACMLCSAACRPKPFGCTVLVRSQGPDPCNAVTAPVGCATIGTAVNDLTSCQIGIVRRQLEPRSESCNPALWQKLGREACQEMIDRRRHQNPPLDPTRPIVVAFTREIFTWNGGLEYAYHIDDTSCGALGVPGSAP